MPRPRTFAQAMTNRERQARYRAKKKSAKAATIPTPPVDPVQALVDWSASTLKVPPGHPDAGKPMVLPDFAVSFLRASWGSHESALSVARKNAKSAICAVLALGYLCGPLRQEGWRGAVCSVSKEKAAELRLQVAAIAEASDLDVTIKRSPYPGAIISASGSFETLSADRSAGHASSFDLVIVDETGLFPERSRDLLGGLRSSVSAKAGRIMHISIRGDSPLFREILDNPATAATIYAAPEDCDIGDRAAWAAANPGLGSIKQTSYMAAEVNRIQSGALADEPSFRAYDLNLALDPTREMICSPSDLRACFVDELPPRSGPVVLGIDAGEATSATAAVAIWPETSRVELWMGFGDKPDIRKRAKQDDAPYVQMIERGELKLYPGRVTNVAAFLSDVAGDLAGCRVIAAAADGYKDSEIRDWLDRADVRWPVTFRRVGAGKDGGQDVRAFQRLVMQGKLSMRESLALVTAISKSTLRRDGNGNPGLDKANSRGRIDLLSAAVIAVGLAEPMMGKVRQRRQRFHVVG